MHEIFKKNEDKLLIKAVEKKWSIGSGYQITLDKQIVAWINLTNECKDGYNDVVEEYTNDLSSRDVIQEILDNISESARSELLKIIEPIDKIFIDHTVKVEKPMMAYEWIVPEKHFWYFRVPKRIKRDELSAFESQLGGSLDGKIQVLE